MDSQLSLIDLIDVAKWQKIQDNFSVVTDVSLRLVDAKGRLITSQSREPRLCSKLLKDSPAKNRMCGLCLPTFLGGKGVVDRNLSFKCEAIGLHNFTAPLTLDGKALAYFIMGPVILVMRKPKEDYLEVAQELELDLEDLWSALLEIKVISFHCAQSLLELIKDLGEYTLKLSYKSVIKETEIFMSLGPHKLNKLLEALLDVAFEISGANVGSVMFLDRNNNELIIKASRGIPEDIVKNTRVKIGSQVSGLAVKEGESFLIDENTTDNRIKPYLKRPYISSSMVIPLKIEDRVTGVMNIGVSSSSSVRFNKNNVRLMNRLVDLTALAIHT